MKLLILGAGAIQQPIIRECKSLGHIAIVADYDPAAPGLADADKKLIISTNDTEALLEAANELAIDGVITTSDYPVRSVARIACELGLPGLSERCAEICTDKYLQRRVLGDAGLRVPHHLLITPQDTVPASWCFPVIVKPVDSSASRGVQRVDGADELYDAVKYAKSFSRSGCVIVEEFLKGYEFSVEVLVQHGAAHIIAITQKSTSGDEGRYFVEEQHIVPAEISQDDENAIRETVSQALIAVRMDNCASHTEVMMTAAGPVIIEIAARLGGDFITSDLVPLATGVDMMQNLIRISLGETIDPKPRHNKFAGIHFITPENYDLACAKHSLLRNDPRLKRFERDKMTGNRKLQSSLDRLGYWIVCADSRHELQDALSI
jgi:biotin carboxylase